MLYPTFKNRLMHKYTRLKTFNNLKKLLSAMSINKEDFQHLTLCLLEPDGPCIKPMGLIERIQ